MALPVSPRLRFAPLLPALAALLVLAATALALLPGALATEAAHDLAQSLRLSLSVLPPPNRDLRAPDPELQRAVVRLTSGTDFRLTLIALDGTVLADSASSFEELARLENHLHREEVAEALARAEGSAVRHSSTTGEVTAYAARLVSGAPGASWIVRLALPARSLATVRAHLVRILGGAALAATAIALLVAAWLNRRLYLPLARLIRTADRIGAGEDRVAVEFPDEGDLAILGRALDRIERERERQLAAVAAERDHLRDTVAAMSEGVLVTDGAGAPRLVNPALLTLFDLPASAAAGALFDLAREPRLVDLVAEVLRSGETAATEIERHEPEPRTLALLAAPLAGSGGVVVLARDLTATERVHRMRKEFVANVSHELKTPLTAIRGYAETLVDGAVESPQTALRFSERILEQCRRLGELLDDLLTLSRLESTEPALDREPVDLRASAREAAQMVDAAARARAVAIEVEPGAPVIVEGDAEGLLRMLSNLLDNAVKYNREGGSVTVRCAARGDEVTVEVADTGIGIPVAHLGRIFERFYRVDRGRAREEGGTGLGLAIVKHVAQAHRGRVEVESRQGEGSIFRVVLPAAG